MYITFIENKIKTGLKYKLMYVTFTFVLHSLLCNLDARCVSQSDNQLHQIMIKVHDPFATLTLNSEFSKMSNRTSMSYVIQKYDPGY